MATVLLLVASAADAEDGELRTILVPPFENVTETKSRVKYKIFSGADATVVAKILTVDRYSYAPRGILEDLLTRIPGVHVVEQERLDVVLSQLEPAKISRYDSTRALELGRLLGANAVVLGTVESIRKSTTTTNAYGIRAVSKKAMASVRVRVIDIESRAVTFSRRLEGTQVYHNTQFAGTSDSDVAFVLMEDALNKLRDDSEFLLAVAGARASRERLVRVEFRPSPKGSDVIVDGVYKGSSPMTLRLPVDRPTRILIRKRGFVDWIATVRPASGLVVSPDLQAVPEG